ALSSQGGRRRVPPPAADHCHEGNGDGSATLAVTRAGVLVVLVLFLIVFILVLVLVLVLLLLVLLFLLVLVPLAAFGLGDLGGQVGRLAGPQQALLLLDHAVLPQLEQALVEQEHAVAASRLDAGVDAVSLVLADQVLDGRRHHHHLVGGDQALG